MEITRDGVLAMIEAVPEDFSPSKYTQSTQAILEHDYPTINLLMAAILDRFASLDARNPAAPPMD
jgi:hypothetical protein